jgi:hypothetical protein
MQGVAHGERHVGDGLDVIGTGRQKAAGQHVGVADGLDLLQPELDGQSVEIREQRVQQVDEPGRGESR